MIQLKVTGLDGGGREVEFSISSATLKEFNELVASTKAQVEALKPVPQKAAWTPRAGGASAKKPVVYLPDAPKCAKHGTQLDIREWKAEDGNTAYYWTCHYFDPITKTFCREKHTMPRPTAAQIAKWKELNPPEALATAAKP